jgi:hypothetical protein
MNSYNRTYLLLAESRIIYIIYTLPYIYFYFCVLTPLETGKVSQKLFLCPLNDGKSALSKVIDRLYEIKFIKFSLLGQSVKLLHKINLIFRQHTSFNLSKFNKSISLSIQWC